MADLITHRIEFASPAGLTPGYLAHPTYADPHRGVVLVQEWWGLDSHIEEVARRFARSGFVALVPNLVRREATQEPDDAQLLAMAIDRDRAIQEVIAAAKYLKNMDQVAPRWMGLVGWSMGAELALSASTLSADFAAVVAFYGQPLGPFDIPKIQAPILGLYAERDDEISVDDVRGFERKLEDYRLPHEIILYPGTQHAFFNDTRPETYDESAARESWDQAYAWLRQYLG